MVVNQAHAGGTTAKSLVDEGPTASVAVSLVSKWYNAPNGLGRAWLDVTTSRSHGTVYPNTSGREMDILYSFDEQGTVSFYVDGDEVYQVRDAATNVQVGGGFSVGRDEEYEITRGTAGNRRTWMERR